MKLKLLLMLCLPVQAWAGSNIALIYDAFGSRAGYMLEGRVIEAESRSAAQEGDGKLKNLWRNVRTLKNEEREGVKLTLHIGPETAHAVTDDEGFFQAFVKSTRISRDGWQTVRAEGKRTHGEGQLLLVPRVNKLGVISDIDDTIMVSEVTDKKKLLENTFLKNPKQRKTFPCTASFYRRLLAQNAMPAAAPMFYVSASPRQLNDNLQQFLKHHSFPRGVLITKRVNGDNHDPLLDQQKYKLEKIEAILAALNWVNFVLIGDDGERDPEIFRELQQRYPERIHAVYIRKVNADATRASYAQQMDLTAAASCSSH